RDGEGTSRDGRGRCRHLEVVQTVCEGELDRSEGGRDERISGAEGDSDSNPPGGRRNGDEIGRGRCGGPTSPGVNGVLVRDRLTVRHFGHREIPPGGEVRGN